MAGERADLDAGMTMRPHPRSILLAAALIAPAAAFAACGNSDQAARPAPAKAASPTSTSPLQAVVAAGSPGVIGLVNDGHGVHLRRSGVADTGSGRAMRPTDRFRVGSITKSFVSTVALQLVGEGTLSLSDTVERWLPGILPYGDHVTLRQLLNLTSGVPDDQSFVEAEWLKGNMTRSWSGRELVALVAGQKPDFAPGTSWGYSNTNYALAGLIIERASGHPLGDELAKRIFKPLRLRHTSFPVNATAVPGAHARGYALVDGALLDVTELNPSGTWAAGNLVSTAADVARFWRALLGGKLLAPKQLAAMKTTVPAWEGTPLRYGLGIQKIPSACGTLWGNGGSIAGYSNMFQNSAGGRRQAAVIVNANPSPEAVGEARDVALKRAMADALGNRGPC
jgi:D-alanyl-D-alanine carboxypeptidase